MAHGTLTVVNPVSDEVKNLPVGYSWTVLFWGCFPALFRQDWVNFGIMAGVIFAVAVITVGTLSFIPLIVFSFIYNKMCLKRHLDSGWKIKGYVGTKTFDAAQADVGYNLEKYMVN